MKILELKSVTTEIKNLMGLDLDGGSWENRVNY